MSGYWTIVVEIETHKTDDHGNEWSGVISVPTFCLHDDVQGIVSMEHAATIVVDIVNPLGLIPRGDIHMFFSRDDDTGYH